MKNLLKYIEHVTSVVESLVLGNRIHTIILDMDDVLNTCTPHIAAHYGVQLKHNEDLDWYKPEYQWDIVGAVSHALRLQEPMNRSDFWNGIPCTFWETIPKSTLCDELIQRCNWLVGKDNVMLATSPTLDSHSYGYKHKWMLANLPTHLHRQFAITPIKERLSMRGTLLIDDRTDNCVNAIKRKGKAICVPKPWNMMHDLYEEGTYACSVFSELAKFEA